MMAWQAHCSDERPVLEDMNPMACVVEGQQVAAEWVADDPKWMLARWRCEQGVTHDIPS
jgi:hypothetical protein